MRMRVRAVAAVLSLLWIAAAPLAAQQAAGAAEEAEHDALRQVAALYEKVIREGAIEALAPHLAPDFHGVMVTGRVVNSLEDLRRYWTDIRALIGEGGTYTTTLQPERSIILGDLALARGTTDDTVVTGDGTEFRFRSYWTATLQKDNAVWKIRQVQGSIDPVDNVFVRTFTRRAGMLAGGLGAGAGLLLGAGIAAVFLRRRTRT